MKMNTRWSLKPGPEPGIVEDLMESLGVEKAIARLLAQRDIKTFDQAKKFFRPNLKDLHDPYLMKDMKKAVVRIERALAEGERILVYGDYDVDGTTSVALMSSYLRTRSSDVATYIPDRYEEGYGISYKGIDFAADNDISLIIALDCGIKAIDKVAYASKKNIDFIICDHHRPGELIPNAVAVLDAKRKDCHYPYKDLCGCGVGFKLIQALAVNSGQPLEELRLYLDLVATAIGADIVPITGENRILAYYGLQVINQSPRPGIKALLSQLKKEEINITDVIFVVAPRINAAGRMKHGLHAVTLLCETNELQALHYAEEIEEFNASRKETDRAITLEALSQIKELKEEDRLTTVVYADHWHKGVIGIVASRLTETYYRPTLVFTKSGNKLAASARSVRGFDVYNALEACQEHIEQFGGHMYAAGLTIKMEEYENFKRKFEEVVTSTIDRRLLTPEIAIDAELQLDEITPKFWRILNQFAPFGPGNVSPVFMSRSLTDSGFGTCVGKDRLHLKCRVSQLHNRSSFGVIGFNLGEKLEIIKDQKKFSAVYCIDENRWNGDVSLQLKLKDIKED